MLHTFPIAWILQGNEHCLTQRRDGQFIVGLNLDIDARRGAHLHVDVRSFDYKRAYQLLFPFGVMGTITCTSIARSAWMYFQEDTDARKTARFDMAVCKSRVPRVFAF